MLLLQQVQRSRPRSPAASEPGTPSSASCGRDDRHAPPRRTSRRAAARPGHQGLLNPAPQLLEHRPQPAEPPQPRAASPAWPTLSPSGTADRTTGRPPPSARAGCAIAASHGISARASPLRRAEPPLHEQVPVHEQLTHLLLDPLVAPRARLAAFELDGPAAIWGRRCQRLRSCHGARIALFPSCRMSMADLMRHRTETAAIGSGYGVEPSVVIPWTVDPRASKALRKRRRMPRCRLGSGRGPRRGRTAV